MHTASGIFSVLSSIVLLAIVTTLVLPGRGTAGDITASGNAFARALNAALGRG